jgi:tetratricopeptide (TPR) repeat protein
MKSIKIYLIGLSLIGLSVLMTGCNKYLDKLPDNRAELNNKEKIAKLLVSAYPASTPLLCAELSSDNVDDYGVTNPNTSRLLDQLFYWKDVTEDDNDSPKLVWEACYAAIASANQALYAIEELGNPAELNPQRGEALLARAYGHFLLVNLFSQHYSTKNGATDLGIVYLTKPEQTLNPTYKRNTVAEVYNFIVADIEAGIPLISDAAYGSTPKFHFNAAAANAFAARVSLYMQQWEKAVNYANRAIGTDPRPIMRDNKTIAAVPGGLTDIARAYTSSTQKANLLILTPVSGAGANFGAYYTGSRYSHGAFIDTSETFLSRSVFGANPGVSKLTSASYVPRVLVYSGTNLDKHLVPRVSYQFEVRDPVSQTGFAHGVFAAFTTEETLLTRAEAYVQLKQYDNAVRDMQYWVSNNLASPPSDFSQTKINNWCNALPYYSPKDPSPKKRLSPEFTIDQQQENMLHAVLFIRRLETMHTGLRWCDIKRYNMEVTRRVMASGVVGSVDEAGKLKSRDNRMAVQLPVAVIAAGLEPNPR